MAVVLLGGARLPRTTGPPTDLEEGIAAPVSAREGADPNQVIGDQLLEESRQADAALQGQIMMKAAGLVDVGAVNEEHVPGDAIHEMGGACMGTDPRSSVVNRWSQAHDAANLFITDGSAAASTSCANPSMTFMALTARAADHAVKLVKAGTI